MERGAVSSRLVRFGPFELDTQTAELSKNGRNLKLQEQPFRLLILLLEQPGELVTRERVRNALWPEDTFVDFEHSLNAAVAKLRQVLGDSAENPRFVATVPRRGYRFIAPVEEARPASAEAPPSGSDARPLEVPPPAANAATPPEPATKPRPPILTIPVLATAAALILLALFVAVAILNRARQDSAREAPTLHRITSDAGLTTDPAISRDGSLLAYASDRSGEGHLQIWVQQPNGAAAIRLTHSNADDRQPSFSPDGTEIVFRSERGGGGIYVVSSLGGPPRLIAQQGRAPRFSPDGHWIAYWVGLEWGASLGVAAGRVYVIPAAGGYPREVSTAMAIAGAPIWSPDGRHLLVFGEKKREAHYEEAPDWWVVPVEGGQPVQTGAYASFARKGLGLTKLDTMPFPSDWIGDKVLFSAKLGDSVDLWQVSIRSHDWQITGKAERLTSVAGAAVSGSATSDGRFVFSHLSQQTHFWTLPVDDKGIAKGPPSQLTDSAAAEYWPSVSADGAQLTFTSTRTGKECIWLKDLNTGKESPLPSTREKQEFPKLSPDGRRIAFTAVQEQDGMEQQKATIYVLSLDTMLFQKIFDKGDWVWTWSPFDGRYLLCKWGATRHVVLLDPISGKISEFLRDPGGNIFQPTFSPDGRWLAFMDGSGLLVAPYRGPREIPKHDWIRITGEGFFDDKPRWSSNGSLLYFTSDRDGSRCLWSQRLDPAAKTPIGAPVPVYHFHSGRISIGNVGAGLSDIAVTGHTIIFPQTEFKGNLWSASSRK